MKFLLARAQIQVDLKKGVNSPIRWVDGWGSHNIINYSILLTINFQRPSGIPAPSSGLLAKKKVQGGEEKVR